MAYVLAVAAGHNRRTCDVVGRRDNKTIRYHDARTTTPPRSALRVLARLQPAEGALC